MAEAAPILARKILGSLRPANGAAKEAFDALSPDALLRIRVTKASGNTKRLALYWIVLAIAAPMLEERLDGPMTTAMLHRILKRKAGLAKPVKLPSGEVEWDYESVSFEAMPEAERAKHIDWSIRTLAHWLGCSEDDLLNEGRSEAA
jgi:hypothetical protein